MIPIQVASKSQFIFILPLWLWAVCLRDSFQTYTGEGFKS